MDLICSAGKGIVSKEECLACATDYPLCGADYLTVRYLLEEGEREDIHVTDITGCPRRAWRTRVYGELIPLHFRVARRLGTSVHKSLEGEGTDEVMTEVPLEALGLVGTCDAFWPKTGRVVDHKTTRWMKVDKLPYGNHSLQVNIYAELLRQMGYEVKELAISYIDMSGPTKCRACSTPVVFKEGQYKCSTCDSVIKNAHLGFHTIGVPMMRSDDLIQFVEERVSILQKAYDENEEPAAEPSFLCKYCSHLNSCLEGQAEVL